MGLLIVKSDIEELISTTGVDDLTDDGVEDDLVNQMIEYAENFIFGYIAFKYSPTVIAQSPEVKQMAVYLAAHFLSERRGNPAT